MPGLWLVLPGYVSLVPLLSPQYFGFISFGGGTSLTQQTSIRPPGPSWTLGPCSLGRRGVVLGLAGKRSPCSWSNALQRAALPHAMPTKSGCPPFAPTLLTLAVIFLQARLSAQPGLQAGVPRGLPASMANSPCFFPALPRSFAARPALSVVDIPGEKLFL